MKIEKLLLDHSIDFSTEHKNVRDGWVGMDCPFCGSSGKYHMGYNTVEDYFSCWQCGGHSNQHTLSKLLRVSWDKAGEIMEKYGGTNSTKATPRIKVGTNKFKLPSGDLSIHPHHRNYLYRRGYDPDTIVSTWELMGTGPSSKLDELNYRHRILAPIYWNGRLVSFQARDITNQAFAKYMACPPEREIISHKHVLYGKQELWGKKGICVEGITDVWRMGTNAFATLGIKFTRDQMRLIAQHFEEVFVLFDPEKWAQWQAQTLVNE